MASVQSVVLPENPVQPINSPAMSKPDNSFQKLLQTKSSDAEADFQDSLDGQEAEILPDLASLDAADGEEISLQAENLIPMAFIPVLEQVQLNASEPTEQPEIVASVNALSEELFAPSDRMADFSLLSALPEENAAAKPLTAVVQQEPVQEVKSAAVVMSGEAPIIKASEGNNLLDEEAEFALQREALAVQDEEMTVKQTEVKNDKLNLVKDNTMVQTSAVLAEGTADYTLVSDKSEKNLASAKNKLSAPNLQPEKDIAQSADKTTESRSFWENVSSRLTVRKEISEQPSGNMSSQQPLTEANLPDTALNSKDIGSVNERLNQLFDFTDQDNVLDQVVKKVEIDLKSGQTEMRMQLKPENLGEVQMKVVVEDGKLNAHFLTSTTTAKEALEANVQQLKQSLQEQGVRVEKIAVLLSSGDLQFNQKQQDESLYQNQKVSKNWRKSGIADYESSDEAVVSRVNDSNQILSAEQVDYRA